jgi:hypothetical protein
MTHATVLEPQQHFGAGRLRRLTFRLLKRLAPFDDIVAEHVVFDDLAGENGW